MNAVFGCCTAGCGEDFTEERQRIQIQQAIAQKDKCGVGIAFGVDDPPHGPLVVKGFVPSGPAAADGTVQKGDVLVEIDGLDIRGKSVMAVTPLMYGERHSQVTLGFARATCGIHTPGQPQTVSDNRSSSRVPPLWIQGETPRNEVAAASMMEQNMLDENHLHFYRVVLLRGDTIPFMGKVKNEGAAKALAVAGPTPGSKGPRTAPPTGLLPFEPVD
eukprot:Tamp_25487.p1 GENE.Tamp_25487~~Tamp_25487.p1  ORF type:complete len:217 (-),score=26.22 Tamp_25487:155-805(-)